MQMREIKISILAVLIFTFLCGVAYPLAMTLIAQVVFPGMSQGSLISNEGGPIGSTLIGQGFKQPRYFQGRPSATDPEYNAGGSGASNSGPSNAKFLEQVRLRVETARGKYGLEADAAVPADLVTASASGLDPHISIESAFLQARLVAKERNLKIEELEKLVISHVERPFLGFWGNERINILLLNRDLDLMAKGAHE